MTRPQRWTECDDLAAWVQQLKEHSTDHGYNCICMDGATRDLRRMLAIPEPPYGDPAFAQWLEGQQYKYRMRLHHILMMIIRRV